MKAKIWAFVINAMNLIYDGMLVLNGDSMIAKEMSDEC
jgi:hypothetical protein